MVLIFIGWEIRHSQPIKIAKGTAHEQALGGIPLGFGIVVEDNPSELPCTISLSPISHQFYLKATIISMPELKFNMLYSIISGIIGSASIYNNIRITK